MRNLLYLAVSLLLPLFVLTATPGCKKETEEEPPRRSSKRDGATKDGGTAKGITAPRDGVLKGKVTYDGTPPAMDMISEMKDHKDREGCLAGSEREKIRQTWLVAKDGGVANAVIWLAPPKGQQFQLTAEEKKPKEEFVEIDQPHCAFIPHVVALRPGQSLKIRNSAGFPHNTKIVGDINNPLINMTIAPKSSETKTLKPQRDPLNISCDFHNWMTGKVWVMDHPFVAVTKDDGSFEIPNVPTGVELQLVGWHEGTQFFINGSREGRTVNLKKGDNVENLTIKAK